MFLKTYYALKPWIPRNVQLMARRAWIRRKMGQYGAVWPIDAGAGAPPADWPGWPEKKRFALVLTHDVEDLRGLLRVTRLMEMEERLGFRSSFNFVPEKYEVSPELRMDLEKKGFEVGVHGLNHDGKYLNSRNFLRQGPEDQQVSERMERGGIPDAGHAPQAGLVPRPPHRIRRFHVRYRPVRAVPGRSRPDISLHRVEQREREKLRRASVHPPQDFLVFIMLREKHLETWKRKMEWVVGKAGMVLFIAHPDYMNFGETKMVSEEYPAEYYGEFLKHIREKYHGEYWNPVPRGIAEYTRRINGGK
jgi:hypothetical protein